MLEKQINDLRKKLNQSIEDNLDFSVIYKLSTDLDRLIVQYYKKDV